MSTTTDLTVIKKHILTKAQYDALESKELNDEYYVTDEENSFPIISSVSVPAAGLSSNTKYNFGVLTASLTITLKAQTDTTHVAEYCGEFTTDANNTYTVIFPSTMPDGTTIKWDDLPSSFTASTRYLFSIEGGCGIIRAFKE